MDLTRTKKIIDDINQALTDGVGCVYVVITTSNYKWEAQVADENELTVDMLEGCLNHSSGAFDVDAIEVVEWFTDEDFQV